MTVRKIGRRFFLLGAGGASLAVPSLTSILPRSEARAQATPVRRFLSFMTDHGGVWQPWFFPDESLLTDPLEHPMHTCRRGNLRLDGERLSDVLRSPSLTPALVSKMNVVRGLDVPFYVGHVSHILGNYGPQTSSNDATEQVPNNVTGDQLLANSRAMYPSEPRLRSMAFSPGGMAYVDPARGAAGGVRPVERLTPRTYFDLIYVPGDPSPPTVPARDPIDAVRESYRRLLSPASSVGRRLGRDDRERLDQYISFLEGAGGGSTLPPAESCGDVDPISDLPTDFVAWIDATNYRALNSLILATLMCDGCRIVHSNVGMYGWNGLSLSHTQWHDSRRSRRLAETGRDINQGYFSTGLMDLVTRMDSVNMGEGSLLDQSLVWWSPEAGAATHEGDSIPVVTFGGASNAFRTGQYLDFRDMSTPEAVLDGIVGEVNAGRHPGVNFFQWTTTYLEGFGVPRTEWAPSGRTSLSHTPVSASGDLGDVWRRDEMERTTDRPLPGLLT